MNSAYKSPENKHRTDAVIEKQASKWPFYFLLGLLIWLPLPMGSNRLWAWTIMEVWVFSLAAFVLFAIWRGRIITPPALYKARWVILLMLLWIGYGYLMTVPMPIAWVEILSPQAADIYSQSPLGYNELKFIPLSLDINASITESIKNTAYVIFFVLILILVNTRKRMKQCVLALILAAVFQSVYGSLMVLSGFEMGFFVEKEASRGVATGTFINRNHLAGFLEMTLAIGIGFLIGSMSHSKSRATMSQRIRGIARLLLSKKILLRLCLAIMVIALVLTRSRMGNTAFFTSMLVTALILLVFMKKKTRSIVILIGSLIIIDILILGSWFGLEKVKQRIKDTTFATETRDEVNIYAYQQWRDYWITGSGPGSFYSVFPKYRGEGVSGFFDHAHNDYIEHLSNTGIIGSALIGSVIVFSLGTGLFMLWRYQSMFKLGMVFGSVMGIISILIHSTVDFNLHIPANAVIFMLLLALPWLTFQCDRQ
ncbi:MAG: O-antigen ligase family protein [Gammaproteobacteria bacterium]|nr:O-antigen ligase family protein [Gammaproteobacteria bacterium]